MKKLSLKWGLLVLGIVAVFGGLVFRKPTEDARAQIACPTGLTTNISQGATLTGMTPLYVGIPTTISSFTINKVIFKLDGQIIGQARSTSGTNSWSMQWATQLAPVGPHQLNAMVDYNQAALCDTPPVGINIAPSTTVAGVFAIDVLPPSWSGLTNTGVDFMVTPNTNTPLPQTELAQYVVYEWNTNIGTLAVTQGAARFNSGGTAGTGIVHVKAMYGGRQVTRDLPIQVQSQNVPVDSTSPPPTTTTTTTTNTTTSPPPTTTTTTTPLTQEQKTALIANQLASQPEVLSCANLNLTPARIQELRTSGKRLDQLEFERIKGCFSQLNYVVPSAYAPIAPDDVRTDTIKKTPDTRINNATTADAKTANKPKTLRFQGQSTPNSDVLLYVFSEPLVLYAKTDGDGNWVYDLVDPLVPGNHEAYAVVETSDGTYKKSSAFSFLIQTAQASAENPNGYSLSVQTVASLNPPASKRRLNFYIIASGAVVLIVGAIGGFTLRKTLRHIPPEDSGAGDQGTDL